MNVQDIIAIVGVLISLGIAAICYIQIRNDKKKGSYA